ncbi:fructosamine kinase family protein [Streptomyces cyaneogriseus]|uniref:fructosamine kinase family protein n=1 Tax=Streptomyces cyaneogriseus TaxID=68192 RepID=UPI000A3FCC33|nr:fructosamine kinase family protein [Streptomyces cyaneogriseus]
MTDTTSFLLERLHAAGLTDVVAVEPATGGLAAIAGVARRRDGTSVFVKAFGERRRTMSSPRRPKGSRHCARRAAAPHPRSSSPTATCSCCPCCGPGRAPAAFWEQLAHALAHLHTTTRSPRFGWHRDNWLGRRRQVNTWNDDGFEFFFRASWNGPLHVPPAGRRRAFLGGYTPIESIR